MCKFSKREIIKKFEPNTVKVVEVEDYDPQYTR